MDTQAARLGVREMISPALARRRVPFFAHAIPINSVATRTTPAAARLFYLVRVSIKRPTRPAFPAPASVPTVAGLHSFGARPRSTASRSMSRGSRRQTRLHIAETWQGLTFATLAIFDGFQPLRRAQRIRITSISLIMKKQPATVGKRRRPSGASLDHGETLASGSRPP